MPRGRGQSWRSRGKAVPGRVNPRAGSLFRFSPLHRTVGTSPRGAGAKAPPLSLWLQCAGIPHPGRSSAREARGPPPLSLWLQCADIPRPTRPPASSLAPRGRGQKVPSPVSGFNALASPTPPGLRPPPPPRGAGAVVAIPEESRIRESKPPHPHGCVFDGSHPR